MRIQKYLCRLWLMPAALGAIAVVSGVGIGDSGDAGAQVAPCAKAHGKPFVSFSCELLEDGGMHVELADADAKKTISVREDQASAIALRANPGARLLEARLVYKWETRDPDGPAHKKLRWAVALEPEGGIYISGGVFHLAALLEVRPDGGRDHPLTKAEWDEVHRIFSEKMRAERAAIVESYHIEFIDPYTGEIVSTIEGSRGRK